MTEPPPMPARRPRRQEGSQPQVSPQPSAEVGTHCLELESVPSQDTSSPGTRWPAGTATPGARDWPRSEDRLSLWRWEEGWAGEQSRAGSSPPSTRANTGSGGGGWAAGLPQARVVSSGLAVPPGLGGAPARGITREPEQPAWKTLDGAGSAPTRSMAGSSITTAFTLGKRLRACQVFSSTLQPALQRDQASQ